MNLSRGDEKRQQIVTFIEGYTREHGVAPTLTEIADGVGLKSASNVRSHLLVLETRGVLTMQNGKIRTVRLLETAN